MNKITLSVVALSAIGAPVQMHAAELTADQKDAAIKALDQRLSRLINTITTYDDAIKAEYNSQASVLRGKIKDLEKAPVVTQEEVDALDQEITALAEAAEYAQLPYATRTEIKAKYTDLEKAYADAVKETEEYANVTEVYKKYYADLGVEALGERIASYDLGSYDIVNDKQSLLDEITKISAQIKKYRESISKDNDSYGNSDASHQLVVKAVADFQAVYDAAWETANTEFTGEIYKDWQEKVFGLLREQLIKVNQIKAADEADALKGEADKNSSIRIKAVNDATAEVENIIDSYTANKTAQETAKATADETINGFQGRLDKMKAELKDRGLTVCDADINAAQALVDDLKTKVDEAYKAHTVSTLEYKGDVTTITKAIDEVDDNNKHKYQAVLDNHDAYTRIVKAIDNNQKTLDDAIKEAKKESNDKKYNAFDHFTKTVNDIQAALTKLKTDADKDYKGFKSVSNEKKATDAANACGPKATAFQTSAADALATYNNIEAAVTAATNDLEALKKVAKDLEVTVNGEVGGKTYGTAIKETQNSIDAINAAVDAANAKADAEHLKALKAIDTTIANASELAGWTEKYTENETNFNKHTSWVAAQNMLTDARNRIKEVKALILGIGKDADLGNMADEIATARTALHNDKLAPLSRQLKVLEDAYAAAMKSGSDEDKNTASVNAITGYNDINTGLLEIEKAAAELAKQAEAAAANKTAYDETVELYATGSDVDKSLAALAAEVEKATGDAKTFYTGELNKLNETLAKIKKNVDKTYGEHKSVDGKDGFADEIKAVKTAADELAKKIVPNENAHNDQLSTLTTLKETWEKVNEQILKDQTSASAGYLARLVTEAENIKALEEAVADAFAKGESADKNTEFMNTAEAISKAITAIANEQAEGYNAAVAADNAKAHELFIATYNTTYGTFGNAVDILNQFSNIKNAALDEALGALLKTHDEIYAFAELLRTLKDSEQKDYDANVLANLEKPTVYDASVWIGTAEQYNDEIDAKLKEYQDGVNKVAYAAFNSLVTDADNAVKAKEAVVNDFKYGKKDAFKDVKDVVEAAKNAAGEAVGGIPTDRMYAVNVDTWMETLKDYEKRLEADLAAAYGKEKTGWLDAVEALYTAEAKEIGELGNIDNAAYLKQLEEKYNATYGEAKKLDENVDPATDEGKATIMQIVGLCKQYYADSEYKNSQVYNDAKKASDNGEENLKAYNDIVKMLDAADVRVADATAWLNAMYITHDEKFPIGSELQKIIDNLLDYRKTTEEKNGLNACVAYKSEIEKIIKKDGDIDKAIKKLKELAIEQSLNVAGSLKVRIDAVKEQYNQVAKEDLDAVKGYDEKIAAYYDELAETEKRWKEGNLKGKLDDARAAILDFESRIVATYDELLKMQTGESLDVTAIIAEALGRADDKLAEVKGWADYNEATGELGDDVVAYLTGKLDAIKAYKAEKEGSLHFYKDNILSDIEKFIEEADAKCAELKAEYEKQKANDDAYTAIGGKLDTLVSDLEKSYSTLKAFTHIDIESLDKWKEGIDKKIADLKESVDSDHDGVLLTKGDQYDTDIKTISDKVAANEKLLKKRESNGIIADVSNALADALASVNKNQYGDATKKLLLEEHNRIQGLIQAAKKFNNASYHNGQVVYDIDGEKLEKPQAIDYSTEAWETVSARLAQLASDVAQLAEDADNLSYVTGDADGDGRVTVNDYSEVRNMILTAAVYEEIPEAKRYGADANNDKQINVADMTTISNIIFYNNPLGKDAVETASASKARVRTVAASASADDELTLTKVSEETGVFGKTVRIAVNVSHVEAFTAGQFDITLPAGMKLAGQSLSERADGHELFYNEIGDNTFRTVVATIDNNEFSGRDGAIVYLDVEVGSSFDGNAKIGVDNIFFSDAAGKSYALGTAGSGATGIDGIEAATVKERIYSVGGQLLKAVNKGLNIIVGENGNTKKILKK